MGKECEGEEKSTSTSSCDSQGRHHALLFTRFGTELVGNLEANLDRVPFSVINSVKDHLLLDAKLLLWRDFTARLWA